MTDVQQVHDVIESSAVLELLQLETFDGDYRSPDLPRGGPVTEAGARRRVAAEAGRGGREVPRRRRRHAAAAGRQVRRQALVAGAIRAIAEAVDGEVEAGVQVRQHGRVLQY